ncbi:MAG: cytidine deaminase [Hyphomicrobiales bacterium]|nr:cytidine deaminase [Hyphomicrobiales bacterium]
MSDLDDELIELAKRIIAQRYKTGWHTVGAALRLQNGKITTGVHLDANVGRIAVCAEAIALGQAITQYGSSDIETIVAVRHSMDGEISIVSPCGMCREMISDYASNAKVIIPDEVNSYRKYKIDELLPSKYKRNE